MNPVRTFLGSMTGRMFLLLAGGMTAAALLAGFISNFHNTREFERRADDRAADQLQSFVSFLDAAPAALRSRMLADNRADLLNHPLDAAGLEPDESFSKLLRGRGGVLATASADRATPDKCFQPMRNRPGPRFMPMDMGGRPFRDGSAPRPPQCRLVSLTLTDGTPLRLGVEGPRLQRGRSQLLDPAFIALFGLGVVVLAYAAAARAGSPLRRLAQASTRLGQDLHRQPLELTGPGEVRQAIAAFNSMQVRLQNHFNERTQMLAAITHDLQTPLTRLRLRLERVQDEELKERLLADLQAMRLLVDEGLELARTAETPEAEVMLDLDSVLESLVEDAVEAGLKAEFSGGCGEVLPLRPLATRRVFANLIDNALLHAGSVAVRVERSRDGLSVFIRDHGPGMPDDLLERAFDPFFRAEASRSRETGGAGLGLTIARMLAAKIGATVTLRNHPEGGLEAQVRWKKERL